MDYYRILEITEQADEEQIKQAYRRLAKKYHPDLNRNHPEAEEKFKDIAEAYEVLSDASKKKAYDLKRRTPVIYGSPGRRESQNTNIKYSKPKYTATNQSTSRRTKTAYNKSERNETEQSGSTHDEYQSNSAAAKDGKSDFLKDLEQYFGFSYEEGKKIVKEQESQETQADSPELAEIFKMFMKMD